jgi:hypothetical protein
MWLCRYASQVDPLIPQMTTCLKDKSVVVRQATIALLILNPLISF